MTVNIPVRFDIATLRRYYEAWDVEGLLSLYHEDVEQVQIDRNNTPSAPRVRHGRASLEGMFRHCAAAGVRASVEHEVADTNRAAVTVTCEFPGGRKVVGNSMLEIVDGLIAREHLVTIGDAAS